MHYTRRMDGGPGARKYPLVCLEASTEGQGSDAALKVFSDSIALLERSPPWAAWRFSELLRRTARVCTRDAQHD